MTGCGGLLIIYWNRSPVIINPAVLPRFLYFLYYANMALLKVPPFPAGPFSLLVQRKGTKKKDTPG